MATADLGVLCAKDEDTCYAPGDAFFGRGGSPPTPKLPDASERRIVHQAGGRRLRLLWSKGAGAGRAGGGPARLPRPVGVREVREQRRRRGAVPGRPRQLDRAPGRVLPRRGRYAWKWTRASGATARRPSRRRAWSRTRRTSFIVPCGGPRGSGCRRRSAAAATTRCTWRSSRRPAMLGRTTGWRGRARRSGRCRGRGRRGCRRRSLCG